MVGYRAKTVPTHPHDTVCLQKLLSGVPNGPLLYALISGVTGGGVYSHTYHQAVGRTGSLRTARRTPAHHRQNTGSVNLVELYPDLYVRVSNTQHCDSEAMYTLVSEPSGGVQ